jgi:hypothetical protein
MGDFFVFHKRILNTPKKDTVLEKNHFYCLIKLLYSVPTAQRGIPFCTFFKR